MNDVDLNLLCESIHRVVDRLERLERAAGLASPTRVVVDSRTLDALESRMTQRHFALADMVADMKCGSEGAETDNRLLTLQSEIKSLLGAHKKRSP